MANVYRRGAKSVHIGTRRSPALGVEQIVGCNLDAGGEWLPAKPPGPVCADCFGNGSALRRAGRGATRAGVAATTAAVLAAAVVFASSLEEPVNIFPTFAPASFIETPGGSLEASPVLVTPEPSPVPPRPTAAPVVTPRPTREPLPTFGPLPTFPPVPTYPPMPTFPPVPTFPPLPEIPLPTLKLCVHPGEHIGVKDICTWPHN